MNFATASGHATVIDYERLEVEPHVIAPARVAGQRIRFVEASHDFQWSYDGGNHWLPGSLGFAFVMSGGEWFDQLHFRHSHDFPVAVAFYYGTGDVQDERLNLIPSRGNVLVQEAPTQASGRSVGELAANETVDLDGVPPTGFWQRKALVVSNEDPTTSLYVLDESGHQVATVFPQTSVMLPLSGACSVENRTASVVPCSISEIWYERQ